MMKLEFLYQSIADIRSTIRALDTKVSFLLVALFIPLSNLDSIYAKIRGLIASDDRCVQAIAFVVGVVFVLTWVVALWSALRTLMGIYDPRRHVDGEPPESCFFPARLFKFNPIDVLGRGRSRSSELFSTYAASIPDDESKLAEQLVFEQVKLTLIVMLKSKRCQCAYWATFFWLLTGGTLWLMHLSFHKM